MYHVYRLFTDEKGNIVHRTPVVIWCSLKMAESYARTKSNVWPMAIYYIDEHGIETRIC